MRRRITGIAWLLCLLCTSQLTSSALGQGLKRERLPHRLPARTSVRRIPEAAWLRIIRAEDERRWTINLAALLSDRDARIRHRATLAAGRIGDERAVAQLASLLRTDSDPSVRAMAAFALGEVESEAGADVLLEALRTSSETAVRGRAVEALGKITAALPKTAEARKQILDQTLLEVLDGEWKRSDLSAGQIVRLGITAVLRARPANASRVVGQFLASPDALVRADAANALARLRAKDASDQLRLALGDSDAAVRANAARALGAAEDQTSLDVLVARGTSDQDQRVRVSALRALASLKQQHSAAEALLQRGETLYALYLQRQAKNRVHPDEATELLEIAHALGAVLANTNDVRAVRWLQKFRQAESMTAPEVEIALARIAPAEYVREQSSLSIATTTAGNNMRAAAAPGWQSIAAVAQGLGEIARSTGTPQETKADTHANTEASATASVTKENTAATFQSSALDRLRVLLNRDNTPALAIPDSLRAFAAFKPPNLEATLRAQLAAPDVMVRATAAELLAELPPNDETANALAQALPAAMRERMNDAALATLDALAKQKSETAFAQLKTALASPDYLVRRRAILLLKESGAGDYREQAGAVATSWRESDYRQALARQNKQVLAEIVTDKGVFVIELLPEAAPLTVHNFIKLARRRFFDNLSFHRVVPNFVIQGGDPRGDGNGGPDYQIRCEINDVPYQRGAVGMALSGKDTGGSQWFVTHAPQPHLDGGYTVFGRIVKGMDVVDRITRGDLIRRINVTEEDR